MATDGSRKPVVLVAEDDADQAVWARDLLEDGGFQAILAPDGKQALAMLDVVSPCAVITDMVMPELDGLGFLRGLAERTGPRPPAVAVSSLAAYLPEALRLGAAAALRKPLDDGLIETLRAVLGGKTAPAPPPPPPTPDETRRLAAIQRLRLDQPAPGTALRDYVRRVARVFDAPVCLVSIITDTRQFWTATCGLPEDLEQARGTAREHSFCAHSVASRAPLVVQDALVNPVFQDNLLVRTKGLRFYAGTPLIERRGEALGTLCLLDFQERPTFGRFDLELLAVLSTRVLGELEWRERAERPDEPAWAFRYLGGYDCELAILGREAFVGALRAQCARHTHSQRPLAVAVAALADGQRAEVLQLIETRFDAALLGRLGLDRIGVLVSGNPVDEVADELREIVGADGLVMATQAGGSPEGSEAFLWHLEDALGTYGLAPSEGPPARAALARQMGGSAPGLTH